MSVLPVASCEFPAVFLGKVALDVVGLGVGPPCLRLDSEETLPALIDERAEMNRTAPGVTPDGGGGASSGIDRAFGFGKAAGWLSARADACAGTVRAFGPGDCMDRWTFGGDASSGAVRAFGSRKVLAREAHSVLKKPLDGGSLEGRSVMDWFVRLIMEPLEHSVLATASVWEPLEHSNCVVTDHVDIDSFWMAPWDAGGTLGDSCRPYVTSWRTVFRSVVRLSCQPAFVDEDCSRLFRSLGQICVLDVHVGQTDVLTKGHSPGMDMKIATDFPQTDATPGEMCMMDVGFRPDVNVPRTSLNPVR